MEKKRESDKQWPWQNSHNFVFYGRVLKNLNGDEIIFSENECNFSEKAKQKPQALDIWCHRKSMTTGLRRGRAIRL